MATITIDIPDSEVSALGETAEERRKFILEAIAVECFQTKQWSKGACGRLMGTTRMGFDQILMNRRIPDNLTGKDVSDGYQAIKKLIG